VRRTYRARRAFVRRAARRRALRSNPG
jgi:hypothetical protein